MLSNLSRLSIALAAAGALIVLSAVWIKGTEGPAGGTGPGGRAVSVGTGLVVPVAFTEVFEAIGTAEANESIVITARETETVEAVYFEEGQSVAAGAVLVELSSGEEAGSLQTARARLIEANAELKRVEQLIASGNVSPARLDQAQAARDAAAGQARSLEARLADRLIRAPFAGLVGLRQVSPGGLVRPGDVITTLDDTSLIKVDFAVPEVQLGRLAVGQTVTARSPAWPGETFEGVVAALDSRLDETTRTITVRAPIPNLDGRLKPGMLLSLEIVHETQKALAVPERAVLSERDATTVLRVKDGKAERAEVRLGARQNGLVAVLEGLAESDEVIVDGIHKVRPGQAVSIVTRDGAPVENSRPKPNS